MYHFNLIIGVKIQLFNSFRIKMAFFINNLMFLNPFFTLGNVLMKLKLGKFLKEFRENTPKSRVKCIAMYGCFSFAVIALVFGLLELSIVDFTTGQQESTLITKEMAEPYHTEAEKDVFERILYQLNSEPLGSLYRLAGILTGLAGAALYIENRNNKKHRVTLEKQGVLQEAIADKIQDFKDNLIDKIKSMDKNFHESQSDMKAKLDKMERKSEEEKHDIYHRFDIFEKNIYNDINEKTNTVKDLLNEKMKGVELVMKNLENNDYRHEQDIQRLEDKLFSFGKHSHTGHGERMKDISGSKQAVDTNKDI